jgi:uroporphyrinogen decarboxylase
LTLDKETIKIVDPMQQLVEISQDILDYFMVDTIRVSANNPSNWSLNITHDSENYYYTDKWGIKWRMPIKNSRYFDIYDSPLSNCTIKEIRMYKWPDPDNKSRFDGLRNKVAYLFHNTDKAIVAIHPNGPGIFELACWMVGMEKFMVLMMTDKRKATSVLEKITDIYVTLWKNFLGEVGKYINVCVLSEDLGTQKGPLISLELYKKMVEPFLQEVIGVVRQNTNAKIFLHSCGDVFMFIPSLIKNGVDILNPIQVSASNMNDTAKLKKEYGKDLVFWGGGCDSQHVLPFGSIEQVSEEVKKRINDLKSNGGFVFAPIHNIQDGVPPANIVTMFKSAIEFGNCNENSC